MDALVIAMRVLHVLSAVVAVGGAFFMRLALHRALADLDEAARAALVARVRRSFKIMVHACVTMLLITGAFNTWRNWELYSLRPGLTHGLWGGHLILGLGVMGVSLWLLAPAAPRPGTPRWMSLNLLLMILTIALASGAKFVRDGVMKSRMTSASPVSGAR